MTAKQCIISAVTVSLYFFMKKQVNTNQSEMSVNNNHKQKSWMLDKKQ